MHWSQRAKVGVLAAVASTWASGSGLHAAFQVQRIARNLNQPTYVLQAPGEPSSLYILQRKETDGSVGNILRLDRATGATSTFLDVTGPVLQDGGLLGMAFHPDYQSNGLFYVSSLVGITNRLEEYKVVFGSTQHQRTLLQYDNFETQHTIGWIGFKPGSTGAERGYLYVMSGDGGRQANHPNFANTAQDLTSLMGKVLRLNVDPALPDAYPDDPNRNYAIPTQNPYYSDQTGILKEIFQSGHRNPWRASFDFATGDLYVGDVGFSSTEEVNFRKNDAGFDSGADFGWARREGTNATPVAGVGGPQGDSLNPIFQIHHPTFRAVTGGYVYRGPVAELRGKYFFADFNNSLVWSFEFDRETDPATFDGAASGISNFADLTALLNSKVSGAGPINLPVSFGEDNAGNLYLVSLADATNTRPWWDPELGKGEVYAIMPYPGDANTDGIVDVADLGLLASHWQTATDWSGGDFDFNGFVDVSDLGILASNWQMGAAPTAEPWAFNEAIAQFGLSATGVPEPACALVAAMGSLLRRRK